MPSVLPGVAAVADAVTTGGFRAGWSIVRWLPERTAYALFDAAAELTHARDGKDVQRLRSNYARVRPDLDVRALEALVRAGVRSYLRYWCDAFRLPNLTPDQIRERVRCEGDGRERAVQLSPGGPAAYIAESGWYLLRKP